MTPTQLQNLLATNPDLANLNPSLCNYQRNPLLLHPALVTDHLQNPSSSSSTKPTSQEPCQKPQKISEKTKSLKSLRGQERAEHDIACAWLRRNNLTFIHAPTFRRVHDLPPGWPDFSLFRLPIGVHSFGPMLLSAHTLFIELKVHGGRFSPDQQAFLDRFPQTKIAYSSKELIDFAADFFHIQLPLL